MNTTTDALGFHAVMVINSMRKPAVYHAPNWGGSNWEELELSKCGRGPVSDFRWHSFALLDPEVVRPCKECYGAEEE